MTNQESALETPGLKILSRHPIFELAEQSPVFVINEKVYTVSEGVVESDFFQDKNGKKALTEIGDLTSFEELHFDRERATIDKINLEYAAEVKKELNSLKAINANLDIPQLIFKQVFPYLRESNHKNRIVKIFGGKATEVGGENSSKLNSPALERIIGSVQEEINIMKSEVEKEGRIVPKQRRNFEKKLDSLFDYEPRKEYRGESLFGKAISVSDVVLTQGKIYELIPGFNDAFSVFLGGKNYSTRSQVSSVAETEGKYLKFLQRKMKLDSLKEKFSKEKIKEIFNAQDVDLLLMRGKNSHEDKGFGFTIFDGTYFVYVEVPEFAIKSQFDGNYYFFNKSKIGLYTYFSDNKLTSYSPEFWMINNNNHPFIYPDFRRSGRDLVKICIGKQLFPTSGKDLGDVIAKRLRQCKGMLMYGYKEGKYPACDELRENTDFRRNVKEKYELEKKGVLIIQGGN
ncbi:hypothetical protein HZA97_07025 [Candidatus Woesearchaeota archaeon]|nr:hypothetical protein [Candidatus Woesearchaeota archaeon]